MRLAVLGAGAWGTALAVALSSRHQVTLWGRNSSHIATLQATRTNARYLPGIELPNQLAIEANLATAIQSVDLQLFVTSTAGMAEALQATSSLRPDVPVLWACKGFELASGRLPHEIADDLLRPTTPRGALSGPSFALEVAQGKPAALTLASTSEEFASSLAADLNSPTLRIYSSCDVIGVELGGALKNIIAIAAGICDGLNLGNNARAALVTRGLAEMTRLGVAMGGQIETFMGLSGLGDLLLTTTGDLSRNRTVGRQLAAGKTLDTVLQELGHVAEGVNSARAAKALAISHAVDMPITEAICKVLFDGLPPREAVQQLLARDPRQE